MGHIYKHTSPSGKAYIGQSIQEPEARWKAHVYDATRGSDLVFHRAIRKYGPDAFTHEILHDGIDEQDELNRLEIEEIARQGTLLPDGYNLTAGGEVGLVRGTPAYENLVAAMQTAEYRAGQSARSKEYWSDPEARAALSARQKERCADPTYRAAVSARSKENWSDPEWRAAHSARSKEYYSDPEMRAAQSARMKERCTDPAWRAANSARQKEYYSDPEARAALSARLKEAAKTTYPSVICDGLVYSNTAEADRALGLGRTTCWNRVKSTSERFRFWHTIPNHNDPECDAVEEVWALMEFAKACPDHENVPDWAKGHSDLPNGFWA